jgi:hypothetical protein
MPIKQPRADEFDEDMTQPAMQGSVSPAGGESTVADRLLEVIGEVAKIRVMVKSLDADGFAEIRDHLSTLREAVDQLPMAAPPRKVVGFHKPEKPLTRKRRKR